jgi:hypothetical protein
MGLGHREGLLLSETVDQRLLTSSPTVREGGRYPGLSLRSNAGLCSTTALRLKLGQAQKLTVRLGT